MFLGFENFAEIFFSKKCREIFLFRLTFRGFVFGWFLSGFGVIIRFVCIRVVCIRIKGIKGFSLQLYKKIFRGNFSARKNEKMKKSMHIFETETSTSILLGYRKFLVTRKDISICYFCVLIRKKDISKICDLDMHDKIGILLLVPFT